MESAKRKVHVRIALAGKKTNSTRNNAWIAARIAITMARVRERDTNFGYILDRNSNESSIIFLFSFSWFFSCFLDGISFSISLFLSAFCRCACFPFALTLALHCADGKQRKKTSEPPSNSITMFEKWNIRREILEGSVHVRQNNTTLSQQK